MKRVLFSLVALSIAGRGEASIDGAQRQIDAGRPEAALEELRPLVVQHPASVIARYDYAVAAYAAGRYAAALEMLEKPGEETEDLRGRRLFQIGNARYRLAGQLAARAPEDAIAELEKAHEAFAASDQFVSAVQAKAHANLALAKAESGRLMLALARKKKQAAELVARRAPEDGIDLWCDALGWYRRAGKLLPDDASRAAVRDEQSAVVAALGDAARNLAERQMRQAAALVERGPERAIGLYRDAIALLQRLAPLLPDRPELAALSGRAQQGLQAALASHGRALRTAGEADLDTAPARAVVSFGQAIDRFREAKAPDEVAATEALLRTAHENAGDQEVANAERRPEDASWVRGKLIQAVGSYTAAQSLRTEAATGRKLVRAHRRLSELFLQEGQGHLRTGQADAAANTELAIANLEKAVQSFQHALNHWEDNTPAREGLEAGTRLLAQLRELLAVKQRMTAEKSAEQIKDPKKIGQLPKDMALKLLDYRNQQPAAKGAQMLAIPVTPTVKDW